MQRCLMWPVAKEDILYSLAGKGFDITGIDLSEDSIVEALQYESENLHFFQHDMRLPFWINYFDYAFNFFTSFGYFRTQREHDNAVRTIAQSLKTKGIFVMDYLNVHYAEDHMVHQSEKEIDAVNYIITKWYDETHFYKKIMVEDEALEEPLVYTEKVAKFSLGDFTEMFAYQGMQMQEVFGDYNFANYYGKEISEDGYDSEENQIKHEFFSTNYTNFDSPNSQLTANS